MDAKLSPQTAHKTLWIVTLSSSLLCNAGITFFFSVLTHHYISQQGKLEQ